jgi:hypothetical protein
MPLDPHIRQFAEAGVDSINRAGLFDNLFDNRARRLTTRAGFTSEAHLLPSFGNSYDLIERE